MDQSTLRAYGRCSTSFPTTYVQSTSIFILGSANIPTDQGQGGGVAIEDAATLAVVLPMGTKPEEIQERLQLYQEIRKVRASTIQEFTREAGKDLQPGQKSFDSTCTSCSNEGMC